eukprot:711054-Amphidinium_carterae.1
MQQASELKDAVDQLKAGQSGVAKTTAAATSAGDLDSVRSGSLKREAEVDISPKDERSTSVRKAEQRQTTCPS